MEAHFVKREYFMNLMKTEVQVIDKDGAVNGSVDKASGHLYHGGMILHRAIDESEVSFEGLRDRFRIAALNHPVTKEEYDNLFNQYEICLRLVEKVEKVAAEFKNKKLFYKDDPVNYPHLIMSEKSIGEIEEKYRGWAANARSNYFSSWKWKFQTSTYDRYEQLKEVYNKQMCGKTVDN